MSSASLIKIVSSLLGPIETKTSSIELRLKKLNGIKAVIFDVYGTLLTASTHLKIIPEPTEDYDQSIIDALEGADFDILDVNEKFSEIYVGHLRAHYDIRAAEGIIYPEVNICDVWQDYLNELFSNGSIDGDITERSIMKLIVRHECNVAPVWPQKNVLQAIRAIQDSGINLGTITTAQFYTPIIMEALFQNSLDTLGFKHPICVWSYEHQHRKPSELLYNVCVDGLKGLGINVSEAVYVGNDVLNDMLPASKCGFKTALFAGDERSLRLHLDRDDCKKFKPNIIFNDFSQLVDCVV